MKKLIISMTFAVVASSMTVFGGNCDMEKCTSAYRIKIAGKTVCGQTTSVSNACSLSQCWAKPCSYRVAGYLYDDEDCECGDEYKCHFWDSKKVQTYVDVETLKFDVFELLRNGGSKNKAQICFKINDLTFAGFGTWDPVKNRLVAASGFFAGTLPPAVCVSKPTCSCESGEETPAYVFNPCTHEEVESSNSIAYGRWSLSYKADKVAIMNRTGSTDCLYPTGFVKLVD